MDYKAFSKLSNLAPLKEDYSHETLQPVYRSNRAQLPQYFEPKNGLPSLYTNPRNYEPYASAYFGSSVEAVNALEDPSFIPVIDRRIDPNKIFSSDIQAAKTVTADQTKMKKIFEKRLQESLTEKGKVGLTEEDVLAMQALTAANNAIVSSINQQVNIKKTIADLRIKQQQQQNTVATAQATGATGGKYGSSPMDIGRSMMDSVFASANKYSSAVPVEYNAPTVDPNAIDDIVSFPEVSENIIYESNDIKTAVIVRGNRDETAEYVRVRSDDSIIDDAPKMTNSIKSVDRDKHIAIDSMGQEYPLIIQPDDVI
jgi:hypothetical protein